jgi:hypothetical protein
MLRTLAATRLARLVVFVPFAAFFAAACEHNIPGPPPVNPPAGTLLAITVTPTPVTLPPSGPQQFAAAGSDINGTAVSPITPPPVVWSVVNGGGTIVSTSGLFTAGTTLGTYNSTVRACNSAVPAICGFGTVIVANTPPVGPSLGTAATYGILAGSTVTCVTGGTINADVGVSPGTTTTGFPPCTITGTRHLGDAAAATAQNDLTTAYNALAGLACGTTVTPADLGGRTLAPGVYCAATSLAVTGAVTLDGQGNANALFVFQMGSTLTTGTNANVALINGAQAKNVYWQVGSSATLGTGTTFRGTIAALTSITLNDNVTMLGRALARNGAVSLGTNDTITLP